MMIALLYGAWEDHYRKEIALALGYSQKDDLKSDLFGDIAALRHAIVHNQGTATMNVQNSKIIPWFRHGDDIYFTNTRICQLFDEVDHFVTGLCGIQTDEEPRT